MTGLCFPKRVRELPSAARPVLDTGFSKLALDHTLEYAVGLRAAQDLSIDEEARCAGNPGDLPVKAVNLDLVVVTAFVKAGGVLLDIERVFLAVLR